MKWVCDEIDLDILKRACTNPGLGLRALYAPLIGKYTENFFWKRCTMLIAHKYLERHGGRPGRSLVYPTAKAKREVKGR
jgi:hypothetical protein